MLLCSFIRLRGSSGVISSFNVIIMADLAKARSSAKRSLTRWRNLLTQHMAEGEAIPACDTDKLKLLFGKFTIALHDYEVTLPDDELNASDKYFSTEQALYIDTLNAITCSLIRDSQVSSTVSDQVNANKSSLQSSFELPTAVLDVFRGDPVQGNLESCDRDKQSNKFQSAPACVANVSAYSDLATGTAATPPSGVQGAGFAARPRAQNRINPPCVLCGELHRLWHCSIFRKMNPRERLQNVIRFNLCHNCLLPTHETINCDKRSVCSVQGCGKKHTMYIHQAENK